ncbi:Flp family type IVb pilin [Caballeronia sp. S22]
MGDLIPRVKDLRKGAGLSGASEIGSEALYVTLRTAGGVTPRCVTQSRHTADEHEISALCHRAKQLLLLIFRIRLPECSIRKGRIQINGQTIIDFEIGLRYKSANRNLFARCYREKRGRQENQSCNAHSTCGPGGAVARACPAHGGKTYAAREKQHQTEDIKMNANILQFIRDRRGITAIEYGLIAGVLALGIMTAVGDVATQLKSTFEAIKTELSKTTS